jgi:hypothetical protein
MEVSDGAAAGVDDHDHGTPGDAVSGQAPDPPRCRARVLAKDRTGLNERGCALACGVSGPVGSRWFRERGGIALIHLGPLSGRYLSFTEREEIALLRVQKVGVRENRSTTGPVTVDDLARTAPNAATRGGQLNYRRDRAVESGADGPAAQVRSPSRARS